MSQAGLILFAGIVVGILIPGYLYKVFHTFDEQDVAAKLPRDPRRPADPGAVWDAYIRTRDGLQKTVSAIDARIAEEAAGLTSKDPISFNNVSALAEQRIKLQSALNNLKDNPPFHLSGFYLETLMFVWPAFYTCLAWLITILAPDYPRRPGIRRWIPIFIGTFVLYRWPTWMRNIAPLRYLDRHVYANGNWDISKGAFFVQELQAVLACVLLVAVWVVWADFIPVWQQQVRKCLWDNGDRESVSEFVESFVRLFVHWQVCSVVLAAAFVPYSFFFWDYVIAYRDKRYLAHALIIHGLWGVTWLLISMPLAWTWYQWNVRYKLRAYTEAVPLEPDGSPRGIEMGTLIGSWNVVGSLAGAALAFGFPVIKEILTHL